MITFIRFYLKASIIGLPFVVAWAAWELNQTKKETEELEFIKALS